MRTGSSRPIDRKGSSSTSVRPVDVDEKTWEAEVIRRSAETPVVVDFWAEWCKPCKQLTPLLEEAVADREVVLAKVDVEANKNLAREYNIAGIPAVKAFKNGREVSAFVGMKTRTAVDAFLDELTKPPVAEELDDAEVRTALEGGDYERAFQILLGRAADPERREEARRVMVALFGELGQDHPLSTKYRKQLASLMF
jgi:thioredoxin